MTSLVVLFNIYSSVNHIYLSQKKKKKNFRINTWCNFFCIHPIASLPGQSLLGSIYHDASESHPVLQDSNSGVGWSIIRPGGVFKKSLLRAEHLTDRPKLLPPAYHPGFTPKATPGLWIRSSPAFKQTWVARLNRYT